MHSNRFISMTSLRQSTDSDNAGIASLDMENHLKSKTSRSNRGKLFQGLDGTGTGALKPPNPTQTGLLEGYGTEICDVLNEALGNLAFYKLFKGTKNAANVVHFHEAIINRDLSHVTVFWKAPIVEQFVAFARKKKGDEMGDQLLARTTKFITRKLTMAEPKLRSLLIKEVIFKKVPRIFFVKYEDKDKEKGNWATLESVEEYLAKHGGAKLDDDDEDDEEDDADLFSFSDEMSDRVKLSTKKLERESKKKAMEEQQKIQEAQAATVSTHKLKRIRREGEELSAPQFDKVMSLENDMKLEPKLRTHMMMIRTQMVRDIRKETEEMFGVDLDNPHDIPKFKSRAVRRLFEETEELGIELDTLRSKERDQLKRLAEKIKLRLKPSSDEDHEAHGIIQ